MAQRIKKRLTQGGAVRWDAQFQTGKNASGRPIFKFKTFTKRGEAKKWVDKQQRARDGGLLPNADRLTLRAYLTTWLEIAALKARPQTIASYKDSLDHYILPELGEVTLAKLTPLVIQQHVSTLAKRAVRVSQPKSRPEPKKRRLTEPAAVQSAPEPRPARTLSGRTVQYALVILRMALRRAVKLKILTENPTEAVDAPPHDSAEVHVPTLEQIQALLVALAGTRYEAMFVLMLTTGLRPGEAMGLCWPDLDLDHGLVKVRHCLVQRGKEWRLDEPKTKKSRRDLPMPAEPVALLRAYRVRQLKERLPAGGIWLDEGTKLVFTTEVGSPTNRENLTKRHLHPACKRAGVPLLSLYALRHVHATLLLAQGTNPKVTSERLGHTSVAMLFKHYAHVMDGQQEEAGARLAGALWPSADPVVGGFAGRR